MANKWPRKTIAECAADEPYATQIGPFGKALTPDEYTSSGVPLLRGINVNHGRFHDDGFVFISEDTADRLEKFESYPGDVLLVHKGTLGQIGLMPKGRKFHRYIMGNSMLRVRCNPQKLLPEYLYYWLCSHEGQHYLFSRVSQVGVPQIQRPLTTLREAMLPVPPVLYQQAIADILGTLDDKIELNRRMNETLEAMARAIFKSWFVDFDPVRAKSEGRPTGLPKHIAKLFPNSFEKSKLGNIPRMWKIVNPKDLMDLVIGGDWGKDVSDGEFIEPAVCIRGADIPDLQVGGVGKMPTRYVKHASLEKRKLRPGDLAFEISGGSPTQSTGRPVLITSELLERIQGPIICSNFCRQIRPNDSCCSYFLYLTLRHLYQEDEFLQFENGTTGIKNFAFTVFCDIYNIVLPPVEIQNAFKIQVAPLFALRSKNGMQTETLTLLRDALLPKLLSGEIRVAEAIKTVERGG